MLGHTTFKLSPTNPIEHDLSKILSVFIPTSYPTRPSLIKHIPPAIRSRPSLHLPVSSKSHPSLNRSLSALYPLLDQTRNYLSTLPFPPSASSHAGAISRFTPTRPDEADIISSLALSLIRYHTTPHISFAPEVLDSCMRHSNCRRRFIWAQPRLLFRTP